MTSDAHAPIPDDAAELRHGDAVLVNGRPATFMYRRGDGAAVRLAGEAGTRVVPVTKVSRA